MHTFVERHRTEIFQAARSAGVTRTVEVVRFGTVCAFLYEHPELISGRSKRKPVLPSRDGFERLARSYFDSRYKASVPSRPSTVPDEAVCIVMQRAYGYSRAETDQIKTEHQHAMAAENLVGALLERYIASIIEPLGWAWCAGDFVKAIDFVKYDAATDEWHALQVKNRDNTENSSSAAIRNGTTISKWFRTFARTGLPNWDAFPERSLQGRLTEQGFQTFIEQSISPIREAA